MPDARLDDLALELIVISARLTRQTRRLHPADTSATWRALSILSHSGPLRLGEFARADQLSQPAATNKMNRLVAAGLVTRTPSATDGRAVDFELSPAGREHLDELRARGIASLRPGLSELSEAERSTLVDAVAIMSRIVRAQDELSPEVAPGGSFEVPPGGCASSL